MVLSLQTDCGSVLPRLRSRLALVAAALPVASAFYLPGFSPTEYKADQEVRLNVNKLTSVKTQLPYSYYTLPYCQPPGGVEQALENLGETLMGDMIENSPYTIKMKQDMPCHIICTVPLTKQSKDKFRSMIEDEYLVNWMLDNLPAATRYRRVGGDFKYMDGFLVGLVQNGHYYVHNHVLLDISYHESPNVEDSYRVVGFDVEPRTVSGKDEQEACAEAAQPFDLDQSDHIMYTYQVKWTKSDVRWASRWDAYKRMEGNQIHWFAIVNSLMILLFLSGMVAMILLRTLHRDITQYNEVATSEEAREETGWKLVHGDVFRRPNHSTMLAVSVGSGMQVLGMSVVTLLLAMLGVLSPAHRGSLLQIMMLLFTLMGIIAGYVSSRFCKVFEGDEGRWKCTTLYTAFLYPGLFFGVFFLLNLLIWQQKSSGAVPFATMFAVLVLWFGVSVPLVFFGAYMGFKKPTIELPVKVSQIARAIPEQMWFSKPVVSALVGGILPFGAVFTELFFIMSSLWLHQFYYLFGFLGLVLLILLVTCAEISIALTYFQLAAEDHQWWWTAFFASGSSSVYVFLYSILYFSSKLQMSKLVSIFVYFGYMAIMSILFMLLTGAIGTIATFFFVRAIYASIKVD